MRDQADNRTNLYLLALAYSSVGKDWPRKVNTCVMHRVGLVSALTQLPQRFDKIGWAAIFSDFLST